MITHIQGSEDLKNDLWWLWDDTYTRKHQFAKAQEAVGRSRQDGYSYLNGFPTVIHGVAGVRAINAATDACLGASCGEEDGRLEVEIFLAGGCTSTIAQGINRGILTLRDQSPEDAVRNDQYIGRLTGYYTERGIPIVEMAAGAGSGWDSAGLKVVTSIVGCLLAAEQGVKYLQPLYCHGLNIVEDTAALQVLKKLTHEYLERFGYKDIPLYTMNSLFHAWPRDRSAIAAQLARSFVLSAMSGVSVTQMKSVDEASSIPTGEGHRQTLAIARQILRLIGSNRLPEGPRPDIGEGDA